MKAAEFPGPVEIQNAMARIGGLVSKTPVLTSATFDTITQASLYFKCENLQKAGAFKFRGATNAVKKLDREQFTAGVCTHSSGNHAQALALAASLHGMAAYIVMPDNAPIVKVNAVKQYGGTITFCEPTLQAREATLDKVRENTGATFIHPYNNHDIIEGQATCFAEMLGQLEFQPDYLVVPVGGGGLLSGTLLTAQYFSPKTRVIGAEPEMANDAWRSLKENRWIPSENPITIADGLKTSLGSLTWPIIRDHVYDIITVSEQAIKDAMFLAWERMKIVIEPSAAVPLAVILENAEMFKGKKTGVIFSGGNVDLKKLPWNKCDRNDD